MQQYQIPKLQFPQRLQIHPKWQMKRTQYLNLRGKMLKSIVLIS